MRDERQAFGNYLRTERELRQIPLGEVASATKIPRLSLSLLEQGEWGDLPGEIFVRGFVRSYARHVGIPRDEVERRYDELIQRIDAASRRRDPSNPGVPAAAAEVGGRTKFGLALVVIIVLILVTITLSLFWRKGAGASNHSLNLPADRAEALPPVRRA